VDVGVVTVEIQILLLQITCEILNQNFLEVKMEILEKQEAAQMCVGFQAEILRRAQRISFALQSEVQRVLKS
jgi:hypothetical protein